MVVLLKENGSGIWYHINIDSLASFKSKRRFRNSKLYYFGIPFLVCSVVFSSDPKAFDFVTFVQSFFSGPAIFEGGKSVLSLKQRFA